MATSNGFIDEAAMRGIASSSRQAMNEPPTRLQPASGTNMKG